MYCKAPDNFIDNAGYNLHRVFHTHEEFHNCVKDIKAVCQEFNWNFEDTMGQVRVKMCEHLKKM